MISKNKIKLIRSLEQKKFRKEQQLFVAVGHKLVDDLLPAFDCTFLAALKEWLDTRREVVETLARKGCEIQEVSAEELQKASLQKNPQDVLAVFHQRQAEGAPEHILKEQLCLGLDGVQDPGNVGTLLRSAAAFGFDAVVLGPGCASPLSPKTLRSSMGAAGRLPTLHTEDLPAALQKLRARGVTTLATALYRSRPLDEAGNDFPGGLCVVIGSEGQGLTEETIAACSGTVRIPMTDRVESLNAGIAGSILLWHFREESL